MNGENDTQGNSTDDKNCSGDKDLSEGKYSGSSNDSSGQENNDENAPDEQGNSQGPSGGSGGEDKEPPPNFNQENVREDEEQDDDSSPEQDDSDAFLPEEEPRTVEKEYIDFEEVKVENFQEIDNVEDIKSDIAELPKPHKRRGRRGRRGRRKGTTSRSADGPEIKRPRGRPRGRPKIPKVYKPMEMIRRKHTVKVTKPHYDEKINMTQKVILEPVNIKQEDLSWDKEVAVTLQNVINSSKKAKSYRAVGRPRKRNLEGDEPGKKKMKTKVTAYPLIEVKKGSDNDWDAEVKYQIPGFCCNDCGAVYQSTAALRRHQNYECNKEPQFKCNDCEYAAKHKGTLKSHIKNRHLPKDAKDADEDTPKKPRKPRKPRSALYPSIPSPI